MSNLCSENKCTGCGACYNICPKCAITMQGDEYGFYKPVIDKERCINCGLCEKICPIDNNPSPQPSPASGEGERIAPRVYAVQNKDDEQRYKSASGGAFPLFAKYIINKGGIVFGVVWNEDIVAIHSKAETIEELEKMYSSKYVQSDTKTTFQEAKKFLDNGRLVLYSGTPCQIAGLKSYLRKDYDNLITVDIVCHGVPSPLVFEKYKTEYMSKFNNEERLLNIDFRSKIEGWSPSLVTTTTTTTTFSARKDNFMQAFLSNLSINDSCLNCQFNKLPRVADLSLGDFWGVDEYDKSLNDNKGLSIVLINSEKGQNVFNKIKDNAKMQEVPLDIVIKCNPNICGSSKPHPQREEFFEDIKNGKSLKYCVKKYVKSIPLYIQLYRLLPQFAKDFIKYKIMKMEK